MPEYEIKKQINKITGLMYVSFVLWIFIIIYQLILGLFLIVVGYGITTLLCMGYNIFGCIRYFKTITYFKNCSTEEELRYIVAYFEKSITPCWIFMFVNLVFGGFIGFAGNLYDLILSYWVKNNVGAWLMNNTEPAPYVEVNEGDYTDYQ